MRVAIVTQVPSAAHGITAILRALGHEPAGLLATRDGVGRYGDRFEELVRDAPDGLDVLVPGDRSRLAPLLRALEPDLLLCAGFPWKIPAEALDVPRLGAVNGHPSLLPRYRGPMPMAWAVRNGESEVGITFHRMDADFDTGPILAQSRFELGEEHSWDELGPKLDQAAAGLLPGVLERIERGDEGEPQDEAEATHAPFFEPEYADVDWSRPAEEVARQVQAWRFASTHHGRHGPLAELDGRRVRILRAALEPGDGTAVECGEGTLWVLETEPA